MAACLILFCSVANSREMEVVCLHLSLEVSSVMQIRIVPVPVNSVFLFYCLTRQPFVVYGVSGCGKTSLLAKAFTTSLENWNGVDTGRYASYNLGNPKISLRTRIF